MAMAYAGVIGLRRLRESQGIPPMMAILMKPAAPDVLTEFENLLGQAVSDLAGLKLDFYENCRRVPMGENIKFLQDVMEMEKFPERAPELRAKRIVFELEKKRRDCENQKAVASRNSLLAWWRKTQTEI